MEWEFTAADVLKGEAHYGLEHFRHDLCEEIRVNLPGLDDPELDRIFRVIYDLHHWLAIGNPYAGFERQFDDQPRLKPMLRAIHAHSHANVEMLGAILQRLIMDGVAAGLPLEHALHDAAEVHARSAARSPVGQAAVQ